MGINLHNIRLGLATNSSSSHTFLIIPKNRSYSDDYIDGEFGWDTFTLATKQAKLSYLGVILKSIFDGTDLSSSIKNILYLNFLGYIPDQDGYIDHQSSIELPLEFGKFTPDIQFFEEFKNWVLRDNIVILGGNDNGGTHPSANGNEFKFVLADTGYGNATNCRKDPIYGFWTIFNQVTGAKIRFSFEDESTLKQHWSIEKWNPEKAYFAELVDIKITDFCPFGCPFCYMDSTVKGKHADYYDLKNIISALAELKVFEVAFGGGEPTLYPNFVETLQYAKSLGIIPNFTTKNLAWLRDTILAQEIMRYAGAFAYSITKANEIAELDSLIRYNKISASRVNLHVVLGTVKEYEFKQIIEEAYNRKIRVTLLGYKEVGRGNTVEPIKYDWWLEVLSEFAKKHSYAGISIDTALASQYEKELEEIGIPKWMYHIQEGKWSAYIDAVELKFAPSSYCSEEEKRDIHPEYYSLPTVNELMALFESF